MSFTSWLRNLRSALAPCRMELAPRRRRSLRAATHHPHFEALEDRCQPSFLAPVSYDGVAVVTADFNGDGALDLAGNDSFTSVSIFLGNADGTFQPGLISATGDAPRSLVVADFDADGKLDVATANSTGVSVLRGNGDGTFQPPTGIGLGSEPLAVAVGDFNGDGKPDLAVTSNYVYGAVQRVSLLLGNGDGSFSGPRTTNLGYGNHLSVAVEDFNGDGRQDFAAVNFDYETVTVLLSDLSGTLQAPTEFYAGATERLAAGDVDGDGDADLVTANYGGVSVLLGDGLGAFGDARGYAADSTQSDSVILGDFNNDLNVDIAVSNDGVYPNYGGSLIVLLGNGDGTFQPGRGHAAGPAAFTAAAGDFNGDGWLDAFTANSVLINDQSWPPAVSISSAAVTEGNAGTVYATFTLSLSFASDQPATVYFATANDSATSGIDYAAVSGDVTFEPGETSKTMTVAVFGDRVGEGYEGFSVNLTGATGAVIGTGTGYGTIVDDEPRVSINDTWGLEGNTGTTPFTFTVTLSAAYDAPVAVNFLTADGFASTAGVDYQATSGTLTIPAGQTSGTIPVLVNGDRLSESGEYDGVERFYINLTSPTAFVAGGGMGSIYDDEPRIRISDVSKAEGKTGQTTLFTFTVTLSSAYDQAVTMSFRTVDGRAKAGQGDYVAKTGTLTFAPGETTKTITIEVKGDSKREADETFYLDLFGLSGNALFTDARGVGTVLNDD